MLVEDESAMKESLVPRIRDDILPPGGVLGESIERSPKGEVVPEE